MPYPEIVACLENALTHPTDRLDVNAQLVLLNIIKGIFDFSYIDYSIFARSK